MTVDRASSGPSSSHTGLPQTTSADDPTPFALDPPRYLSIVLRHAPQLPSPALPTVPPRSMASQAGWTGPSPPSSPSALVAHSSLLIAARTVAHPATAPSTKGKFSSSRTSVRERCNQGSSTAEAVDEGWPFGELELTLSSDPSSSATEDVALRVPRQTSSLAVSTQRMAHRSSCCSTGLSGGRSHSRASISDLEVVDETDPRSPSLLSSPHRYSAHQQTRPA